MNVKMNGANERSRAKGISGAQNNALESTDKKSQEIRDALSSLKRTNDRRGRFRSFGKTGLRKLQKNAETRSDLENKLEFLKWAKNNQLGMWQGKFIRPEEWRRKTK